MHSHTYCSPGHSLLPHCPMLDHRNRHPAPSPSFPSPPSFLFSKSSSSPICGCDRSLVACCPPLTDDTCSERFDWWFPAHLCDLLTACGAINKPERREVRQRLTDHLSCPFVSRLCFLQSSRRPNINCHACRPTCSPGVHRHRCCSWSTGLVCFRTPACGRWEPRILQGRLPTQT